MNTVEEMKAYDKKHSLSLGEILNHYRTYSRRDLLALLDTSSIHMLAMTRAIAEKDASGEEGGNGTPCTLCGYAPSEHKPFTRP